MVSRTRPSEPTFVSPDSKWMALRAENCLESDRSRRAEGPTLVFTLESSIARLTINGRGLRVDRSRFVLLAPNERYRVSPVSVLTPLLTLEVRAATTAAVLREYREHVDPKELGSILSSTSMLPRTRWVDELVHRYRFERMVCEKHDSSAARFLETELVKELYFVSLEQRAPAQRVSVLHQGSTGLERAKALIEANLDKPLGVAELARRCHLSESTLLRLFARELSVSPAEYVRARRLDYAMTLLASQRFSVTEVAAKAGYASAAAFSVAFKRRFRCSPSRIDRDRQAAEAGSAPRATRSSGVRRKA